jgi:hypothetical protein
VPATHARLDAVAVVPSHPNRLGVIASNFTDPQHERMIYFAAGGLVLLGVALLVATVLWWRGSKSEHAALAPLEVMSQRTWQRSTHVERARQLNNVRPRTDADPDDVQVNVAEEIDLDELLRAFQPGFDDLREPQIVEPASSVADQRAGDLASVVAAPDALATAAGGGTEVGHDGADADLVDGHDPSAGMVGASAPEADGSDAMDADVDVDLAHSSANANGADGVTAAGSAEAVSVDEAPGDAADAADDEAVAALLDGAEHAAIKPAVLVAADDVSSDSPVDDAHSERGAPRRVSTPGGRSAHEDNPANGDSTGVDDDQPLASDDDDAVSVGHSASPPRVIDPLLTRRVLDS